MSDFQPVVAIVGFVLAWIGAFTFGWRLGSQRRAAKGGHHR